MSDDRIAHSRRLLQNAQESHLLCIALFVCLWAQICICRVFPFSVQKHIQRYLLPFFVLLFYYISKVFVFFFFIHDIALLSLA